MSRKTARRKFKKYDPTFNHLFNRSSRLYLYNKPVKHSQWYRESWKPLLGRMVLIEGTFVDSRNINLGGYGIKNVLLKNVRLLRFPKEFSRDDIGDLDHLWVLLDRNLMKRISGSVGKRVRCSGFVTEYICYTDHEASYKNISIQVKNADVVRTGKELL